MKMPRWFPTELRAGTVPLWLRMLWKQPWEPHTGKLGRLNNADIIVWLAGLRKTAGVGRRHRLQKELGTQDLR